MKEQRMLSTATMGITSQTPCYLLETSVCLSAQGRTTDKLFWAWTELRWRVGGVFVKQLLSLALSLSLWYFSLCLVSVFYGQDSRAIWGLPTGLIVADG